MSVSRNRMGEYFREHPEPVSEPEPEPVPLSSVYLSELGSEAWLIIEGLAAVPLHDVARIEWNDEGEFTATVFLQGTRRCLYLNASTAEALGELLAAKRSY